MSVRPDQLAAGEILARAIHEALDPKGLAPWLAVPEAERAAVSAACASAMATLVRRGWRFETGERVRIHINQSDPNQARSVGYTVGFRDGYALGRQEL